MCVIGVYQASLDLPFSRKISQGGWDEAISAVTQGDNALTGYSKAEKDVVVSLRYSL